VNTYSKSRWKTCLLAACGFSRLQIATSGDIRNILKDNPKIPKILRAFDQLEGVDRERALEHVLGVRGVEQGMPGIGNRWNTPATNWLPKDTDEEDMDTLRSFTEAVGKVISNRDKQIASSFARPDGGADVSLEVDDG
jgi:hypothetical protein